MFASSKAASGSVLLQGRGVGGGGEAGGQNLLLGAAAENVADLGANVGGEETVNEGVGGRVEGGQTLEKSGDGGVHGDQVEYLEEGSNVSKEALKEAAGRTYLQEVVHHVGTPTEDEDKNNDKGHLDRLHFGLWNEAARGGSPRLWLVSQLVAGRRRGGGR